MVKKALSQSHFEILKLAISPEQLSHLVWFFTCQYRVKEGKRWFEIFKSCVSIIFLNGDLPLINESHNWLKIMRFFLKRCKEKYDKWEMIVKLTVKLLDCILSYTSSRIYQLCTLFILKVIRDRRTTLS